VSCRCIVQLGTAVKKWCNSWWQQPQKLPWHAMCPTTSRCDLLCPTLCGLVLMLVRTGWHQRAACCLLAPPPLFLRSLLKLGPQHSRCLPTQSSAARR